MPQKLEKLRVITTEWPTTYVFQNAMLGVVSLVGYVPEQSTEDKIDSYSSLPMGWDYGTGGPLSKTLIDAAKLWNEILKNANVEYTDALPGDDEITVAGGAGRHYFEIIINEENNSLRFALAYDFEKKQVLYKDNLTQVQILEVLIEALGATWNASALFTGKNTISNRANFSDQLSVTTAGHFRLSRANALLLKKALYAPTPGSTPSQVSPTSPPYFGGSTQEPYLLIA